MVPLFRLSKWQVALRRAPLRKRVITKHSASCQVPLMRRLSPDATQQQQSPAGYPFCGHKGKQQLKETEEVDILTLKWHHVDGRTVPLPVNVRLVGASWNMERTGLQDVSLAIRRAPLAIHAGPENSIASHQIPSEHLFWHLVTMHTGAGSPEGRQRRGGPCKAQGVGPKQNKNGSPFTPFSDISSVFIPTFCFSAREALPPPQRAHHGSAGFL
ncbi:hypothetical protein B0T18DRAFT_116800 [Schizothecium vesticola]|uniref:Uncharacterized protein n=1 Tax=Schizothecium vesticola TaxID=314040 RepID=A0AA40F2J8_9PEZI|nr:hypothetical protein B0T18DRAFT_116800 [Schizothecium vesticola]